MDISKAGLIEEKAKMLREWSHYFAIERELLKVNRLFRILKDTGVLIYEKN